MLVRIWKWTLFQKDILEFNEIVIFKSFSRKRCIWVVAQELDLNLEAAGCLLFQRDASCEHAADRTGRLSWPDIADNGWLPFTWVSLLVHQDLDSKPRNGFPPVQVYFLGDRQRYGAWHRWVCYLCTVLMN